jgi:DNA-binding NarL/FixJ family response regulator
MLVHDATPVIHKFQMSKPSAIKVLHVEDNSADADLVAELLDEYPDIRFIYSRANTLAAAHQRIKDSNAEPYDVVLLDLGLPDSQGLNSLRELIKIDPGLPVVVLTGMDDAQVGRAAVISGAEDYIEKNQAMEGNRLARTLEYSLQRYLRREQPVTSDSARPNPDSGARKLVLNVSDPELFASLLEQYRMLFGLADDALKQDEFDTLSDDIIDSLIEHDAEPSDLIELHSQASRKTTTDSDLDGDRPTPPPRRLLLTMMSNLTVRYLEE